MHASRTLLRASSLVVALATIACGPGAARPPVDRVGVTTVARIAPGGTPSGAHFTLDVVAVPKGQAADLAGDDGHRIFVPLAGRTSIGLGEGDFLVLDANGTDGSASFQLPDARRGRAGATTYTVWARALATPGSRSQAARCAPDPDTAHLYCSVGQTVRVGGAGGATFTDVSPDLLFVFTDEGDGSTQRHALFDSVVGDAFCQADGHGRRVAELRFHEAPPSSS